MTHDTCHMTPVIWHMTFDIFWWVNILSKFPLPSFYGLGVMMFWRFWGKGPLTKWMINKGVCRTAPAAPGPLIGQKSRIWETPNLSTDADRSTNNFLLKKKSIRNDSLFLRLYELVHKLSSPPVQPLPHVDGCNLEQLLIFKALQVGRRVHQSTIQTPPTRGR